MRSIEKRTRPPKGAHEKSYRKPSAERENKGNLYLDIRQREKEIATTDAPLNTYTVLMPMHHTLHTFKHHA